jgi:hypothetical protein
MTQFYLLQAFWWDYMFYLRDVYFDLRIPEA